MVLKKIDDLHEHKCSKKFVVSAGYFAAIW